MSKLMTEQENRNKYPADAAEWEKSDTEHYLCERHGRPTTFIRSMDIVVHDDETECY